MKALITGSCGFVGNNLMRRLLMEGINPISFPFQEINKRNYFVREEHDKIKDVDYIFHCAAELYDESRMIGSNIELTRQLLEITKDISYKAFIYIGSSSEYGKVDHPISEKDPINPTNLYEITKATGSIMCRVFAEKHNKPVVVVRPFSLYGPGERKCRFVPTIYDKLKKKEIVEIYNGVHDWVFIDDFIDVLIRIAQSGQEKIRGDVVNIGTGSMTSNLTVFSYCAEIFGFSGYGDEHFHLNEDKFIRPYDSEMWVCDPRYAKEKYGIECKTTLEEGLKKYVKWRHSFEPAEADI